MLDNGYFKDSNFFIFFYVNFCGEVHVAVLHWLKAQLRATQCAQIIPSVTILVHSSMTEWNEQNEIESEADAD